MKSIFSNKDIVYTLDLQGIFREHIICEVRFLDDNRIFYAFKGEQSTIHESMLFSKEELKIAFSKIIDLDLHKKREPINNVITRDILTQRATDGEQ